MPPEDEFESEIEREIESDLEIGDNALNKFLLLFSQKQRFCIVLLIIICLLVPIGYIIYTLKDNPDIVKQILTVIVTGITGGAGGYFGAKRATS